MPELNTNLLASIPDYAPKPVEAIGRGLALRDLVDTAALRKVERQGAEQEQRDMQQIRRLQDDYDLSKPEGLQQFAAAATRINPKLGMGILKEAQSVQKGAAEITEAQYKLYGEKQSTIAQSFQPLFQMAEELHQKGVDDARIDAALLPKVTEILRSLKGATLSNRQPLLDDQDIERASQLIGKGNLRNALGNLMMSSDKIMKQIETRLAMRNVESEIKHREKEEGFREREVAIKEKKQADEAAGGLSDDAVDLLASRLVTGEKARDVLANIGRGTQGAKDIRRVQNAFAAKAKAGGMDARMIAARQQEMAAVGKELQSAAAIAGRVRFAEAEILRLAPVVRQASAAVPRGQFTSYNEFHQRLQRGGFTDPQLQQSLQKLDSYVTTMLNAYDMLAARGGTDVAKREHTRQLLTSAQSPEVMEAAVQAIEQEAKISIQAGEESMESPYRAPAQAPAPPPAAAPPVQPQGAAPPGGGPAGGGAPPPGPAQPPGGGPNPNDPLGLLGR